MLAPLFVLVVFALWVMTGCYGVKLERLTINDGGTPDKSLYGFALGGPIMLLVGAMFAFDRRDGLLMTRSDRRNPFHTELREALHQYRLLQWVKGVDAEAQRKELIEDILELRSWPAKLKEHDGDRLIAAMRQELEANHQLRRARLEAYEKIEGQVTLEMRDDLNP